MNSYTATTESDWDKLRRKRRNHMIIIAFFCMLALVVCLESPLTRIRSIQVSGNRSVSASRLISDANLHKGESIWQVNSKAVASSIKKREPFVEGVQVHTDLLKGLVTLSVAQKKVVAILESRGTFYNLLSDGTVYGKVSSGSGFSLPIITLSAGEKVDIGEKVRGSDVTILCRALSKLQTDQVQHISQVTFDGLGSATFFMDNGYEVILSVGNLRQQQLSSVQAAVNYFLKKGYAPGLINMSGQPPYSYSPFKDGKGN